MSAPAPRRRRTSRLARICGLAGLTMVALAGAGCSSPEAGGVSSAADGQDVVVTDAADAAPETDSADAATSSPETIDDAGDDASVDASVDDAPDAVDATDAADGSDPADVTDGTFPADATDATDAADATDATDAADATDATDATDADNNNNNNNDADNNNDATLADADDAICQSTVTAITDMPLGSAAVNFETCSGCACCDANGAYPATMAIDCLQCAPAGALALAGGTLAGGMLTTLVGCVMGNDAAPMSNQALFIGGGWQTPSGQAGLEILLSPPAKMFGFSAVPTSSNATPTFVLRGYDAAGLQVAEDSFVFSSAPGGSCATVNPAAQFFGFRPCSDAAMVRVVVETSDANVAIDELRIWRP